MAEVLTNYRFDQVKTTKPAALPTTSGTTNINTLSATTTLTVEEHSGVTLLLLDVNSAITISLPAPVNAGTHFHFVYGGREVTGANILFDTSTDTVMEGSVIDLPSTEGGGRLPTAVIPGSSDDTLTLATSTESFDIHFVSDTSNKWIVWGHATGASIPDFTNP